MPDKKSDDMRPLGAMICIGCGVYELALAASPDGHGWQFAAGIIFIVFGLVRGFYLLREKPKDGGQGPGSPSPTTRDT